MAKQYFDLFDDVYTPGRWELGSPLDEREQEIRTWLFERGEPAHVEGRIRIPIYAPGKALDFSLLAGSSIPVVHARVAAVFAKLAPDDVQLIPVEVDGQREPYVLLNITRVVKCIDDEASDEVRYVRLDGVGTGSLVSLQQVLSELQQVVDALHRLEGT